MASRSIGSSWLLLRGTDLQTKIAGHQDYRQWMAVDLGKVAESFAVESRRIGVREGSPLLDLNPVGTKVVTGEDHVLVLEANEGG